MSHHRWEQAAPSKQNKKRLAGYTLPGGHVEPGEPFVDAVIREMKEQTGLDIKNPRLQG